MLDTNKMVSLLRGEDEAIEKIRSFEETGTLIFTTAITEYELLKGARISSKPEENLGRVRGLVSSLQVLGLSSEASEEASRT